MELASPLSLVTPPTVAALVSVAMAVFVLRSASSNALNRRLALVLALEALSMAFIALTVALFGEGQAQPVPMIFVVFVGYAALPAAYLYFLALLATPLTGWLRRRAVGAILVASVVAFAVGALVLGVPDAAGDDRGGLLMGALVSLAMVFAGVFAIVAAVSAARRTPPGSARRRQAVAFVVAFGVRDVLWAFMMSGGFYITGRGLEHVATYVWSVGPAVITLVYVPILAYGILRTQLFDIDLKIKLGIQRSTVGALLVGGFFAAYKIAEFYLGRNVGWTVGAVFSGVFFFLAPRLNKFADGFASKAMPKVENTSKYVEFRKMEVYRAAVESTLEGGEITEKERQTLERLRVKLGIGAEDAKALESDVSLTIPAPPAQTAS